MKKRVVAVTAIALLAVMPASGAPTARQDHRADWLVALGPPGLPGSGGCYGDVIVVPQLEQGSGINYAQMSVDRRTWGGRFRVTFSTETGQSSPYLVGYLAVTFYDAQGTETGTTGAGGYGRVLGADRIARGTVPRSSTTALFWACEEIGPFTAVYRATKG